VPMRIRGRAFALNQVITYSAVPVVSFLSWQLVPLAPLGLDGWRWIMLIGATGRGVGDPAGAAREPIPTH
jgi:putative MFS transporter